MWECLWRTRSKCRLEMISNQDFSFDCDGVLDVAKPPGGVTAIYCVSLVLNKCFLTSVEMCIFQRGYIIYAFRVK